MPANLKGIPEGHHTVTPSLICKDCNAAIDFYKNAFGAEERNRFTGPDGKIMHAEIQVGDSIIMLSEESERMKKARAPLSLGAFTSQLHLYVPDVDASFNRAVQAGAKVTMPLEDMFWGDRYGTVEDPSGHVWGLATQKEKLTPQEMDRRGKEFFAKMKGKTAA
jgi:PhnB protein